MSLNKTAQFAPNHFHSSPRHKNSRGKTFFLNIFQNKLVGFCLAKQSSSAGRGPNNLYWDLLIHRQKPLICAQTSAPPAASSSPVGLAGNHFTFLIHTKIEYSFWMFSEVSQKSLNCNLVILINRLAKSYIPV